MPHAYSQRDLRELSALRAWGKKIISYFICAIKSGEMSAVSAFHTVLISYTCKIPKTLEAFKTTENVALIIGFLLYCAGQTCDHAGEIVVGNKIIYPIKINMNFEEAKSLCELVVAETAEEYAAIHSVASSASSKSKLY